MASEISVLVVDDHPVVREGLRIFLGGQTGITVIGEASNGREAIDAARLLTPDVILLDLAMPELGGLDALVSLRAASAASHILILTSSTTDEAVLPAMRAGASGFVVKDIAPSALVQAIKTVAAGGSYLAASAARRVLHEIGTSVPGPTSESSTPLTAREGDVLALIAEGLANKAIARQLVVSEKTVKTHVSSILVKLGVTDRTQAAVWAVRHGIPVRRGQT